MNAGLTWKLVLLLSGIFVAGAVVGGVGAVLMVGKLGGRQPHVDQWTARRIKSLTDRLDLTAEQTEKLRPIVRRNIEELGRMRMQSLQESRRVIERMEGEIQTLLTTGQRARYEELLKERREREKRMMHDRRWPRNDGNRNGPGDRRPRRDRMYDDRGEPAGGTAPDAHRPRDP